MDNLGKYITILINTCDAYEDLWDPFFTLLKRYWNSQGVRIILNTETKQYAFDGLDIECVNIGDKQVPYGKRMLHALSKIKTTYVIPLLDDFFLRKPVDEEHIERIISWMESDKDIVYFNQDCLETNADWELNRYPGYKRVPNGTDYVLNMQAAVWRTKKLIRYWRPNVSPWEWEACCSAKALHNPKDKFYCLIRYDFAFCSYGHNKIGDIWGVLRGKWVMSDVEPLFRKENIVVDFRKRGVYVPESNNNHKVTFYTGSGIMNRLSSAIRYLGVFGAIKHFCFVIARRLRKK